MAEALNAIAENGSWWWRLQSIIKSSIWLSIGLQIRLAACPTHWYTVIAHLNSSNSCFQSHTPKWLFRPCLLTRFYSLPIFDCDCKKCSQIQYCRRCRQNCSPLHIHQCQRLMHQLVGQIGCFAVASSMCLGCSRCLQSKKVLCQGCIGSLYLTCRRDFVNVFWHSSLFVPISLCCIHGGMCEALSSVRCKNYLILMRCLFADLHWGDWQPNERMGFS